MDAGGTPHDDAMPLRSEDWLASEPAHELEACVLELDATRAQEAERFARELRAERATGIVERTLAMVREVMASELLADDRADMTALLVRLLHENIAQGRWPEARATVACLLEPGATAWEPAPLVEEFTHPDSHVTASVVRHLDASGVPELGEFIAFARALGDPAADWLMSIVALAGHQRTRRTLVRAIAELCGSNPERLAPWLTDERWYVVRNAVIVVASATGGAPVGLLHPLVRHPELRVRQEIVAALAHARPDAARPLLLELLDDPEPSIRGAALHQLGARRDPTAAAAILRRVLEPEFRRRPIEEVRSVAGALGGCAGDEALPYLEEQLVAPRWFDAGSGPYCQVMARCIARIGTPAALAMLERGAESKTPATRDACRLVLKGMGRG
jgi:HEAT repeat protein